MLRSRFVSLVSTLLLATAGGVSAQEAKPAVALGKVRTAAQAAMQNNDFEAAAAGFRKVVEADPEDGRSWQLLGYCLHAAGKLDEALPVHKKAAEFPGVGAVAAYNVACVYALQGKKEAAIEWLGKAAEKGFDRPEHIATDSDMDSLRGDPGFAKAVDKIKANAGSERVQVFAIENARKCSRVAWFGRSGSPGQIAIQYTPVEWQGKYDEMASDPKMLGRKWRFGGDFWTSLDTSVGLVMNGVEVPAGYYYLTVCQKEAGKFVLGIHDAAKVKKMKIDAFQAERIEGGMEVPLEHEVTEDTADNLEIAMKVKAGSKDHGNFVVHFGGHLLMAPVAMQIGAN